MEGKVSFGGPSSSADAIFWAENQDAIRTFEPSSFDLVYVDPPFATGKPRRGSSDKVAPPSYSDRLKDPDEFVEWLEPRLDAMRSLLTPSGSLFIHLDHRVVHYIKVAMDRIFGRTRFVNEIIWCYSVGGKSSRRFARKHDTILWYARSSDYAFYPDAVRVPRKPRSHMRIVRDERGRAVQEKTDRKTGKVYRYPVVEGKVPEDWWTDIETLNRSDRERTGYPTQKPERLLQRIIDATTVRGDRVADFFAGSGTTGAVAQRTGRGFALVDQNADAARLCYERLSTQGHLLKAEGHPPPDLAYRELCDSDQIKNACSLVQ